MDFAKWISVILAAGALLVGLPAFLYYRKQLRATTASLHAKPLLIARAVVPELSMSFRGETLEKPSLLDITFVCSGADIPPSAFEGGGVRVQASGGRALSILESSPEPVEWQIEKKATDAPGFAIAMEPLLLKAGERCRIKLLCDGDLGDIQQTVRLQDVKQVENAATTDLSTEARRRQVVQLKLLTSLVMVGMITLITLIAVVTITQLLPAILSAH